MATGDRFCFPLNSFEYPDDYTNGRLANRLYSVWLLAGHRPLTTKLGMEINRGEAIAGWLGRMNQRKGEGGKNVWPADATPPPTL